MSMSTAILPSASDMPLPEDLEMERLVLGALITGSHVGMQLDAIIATLSEDDFTLEKHKLAFRVIAALSQSGKQVDLATVAHEVARRGGQKTLELHYLAGLVAGLPRLVSLDAYLDVLRECSRLRLLIVEIEKLKNRAVMREESTVLFEDLRRIGDGLAKRLENDSEFEMPEEIVQEEGVNEFMAPTRARGIEPPVLWLGEKLSFAAKTLTLLAARPSVGKSAFALQCAHEAARRRYRVLFYSLEMSNEDLLRRMIAQEARVNMMRLRMGIADADERHKAHSALAELVERGDLLLFSDSSHGTIPGIIQQIHKHKMLGKPAGFLIVDYMQLMTPVGRFGNRTEEVSSLSRGLKQIAQSFNIPVLALSQLSRESEKQDREPRLSDLRESGSLEQDADSVIFLHRRGGMEDDPQDVRMILAKNRGGPIGRCDLIFHKRYVRFDEVAA